MSQAMLQNAPDLRLTFPRSPNEMVGDYILLGRILDKCRASIAGTIGEYIYNCSLDQRFFTFTGIDPEEFKSQVTRNKSDKEILEWVQKNSSPRTKEEILSWSYETRWATPTGTEKQAHFEEARRRVAPNRPYIQTWMQLLDAEEGRLEAF